MKKHLDDYDILRQKMNQINKMVREVWDKLNDEEKFFIIEVNFLLGVYESGQEISDENVMCMMVNKEDMV